MAWPPRGDLHSTFSICEATLSLSRAQWGPGLLCCHSVCISVCTASVHIFVPELEQLSSYTWGQPCTSVRVSDDISFQLFTAVQSRRVSQTHVGNRFQDLGGRTEQGTGVYSYTQMEPSEGSLLRACPWAPGPPFWLNTNIFYDSCSSTNFQHCFTVLLVVAAGAVWEHV